MSSQPTHVLIADLETTDADPFKWYSAPLEIGLILCEHTPQLPELGRANLLIRPPGAQPDHDKLWSAMPPFVQAMHRGNGLWEEATSDAAWSLVEADAALRRWLLEHTGPDAVVTLGGSGVSHMDHPWLKQFFPQLNSMITYFTVDAGVQRRLLDLAGRSDLVDLVTDVEAKPHRALGDAQLHLAETRRYLQLLAQLPAAAAGAGQVSSASTS